MLIAALSAIASFCGPCEHAGPNTTAEQPEWLADLVADREATLKKLKWAGGVFENPALRWTQTSYIQPQMHPYDRYFYDPQLGYTPEKFLADLNARYGGVDSILMWPTYPAIGIDDRNQFDFFRTMPGGLEGVRNVTNALKAAGVRVLWPYNPWDTGTRREAIWKHHGDDSDAVTFANLLKQTNGDGFNGDTMGFVPESFWLAALKDHYPVAFEPELGGTDAALNWTTMGWGYWTFGNTPPIVDRFKFVTRGRFLTHACDRWSKNKTDNLQYAWFNGDGYETWENVWGTWNGIVPRDGEAIRRVATMLRFFGGKAALLHSAGWVPHTTEVLQQHVYGSRWPAEPSDAVAAKLGLRTMWTVVNRAGQDVDGAQLALKKPDPSSRYYDCYRGTELPLEKSILSFSIESEGFGCVVETAGEASSKVARFLSVMANLTAAPLAAYSKTWTYLPQAMRPIGSTPLAPSAPSGMVHVPRCDNYSFITNGIEVEGDTAHGVDVQFGWEAHPRKNHSHRLRVGPFYIDRTPVTNARYAAYLQATGYRPKDPTFWLRHWNGSATPAASIAGAPVVYISLDEARLYCSWAGGRLPHAWEWQYAAQGTDGRLYPWGNNKTATGALPVSHSGNANPGPPPTGAHSPAGDSPFGVADMVGTVWQYTDEFYDEHTRFVILRGGSNYRPSGSNWYFPNQPELNTHNKYFLMSASYERAGTIGVRCVVDAQA